MTVSIQKVVSCVSLGNLLKKQGIIMKRKSGLSQPGLLIVTVVVVIFMA